VPRLWRTSKIKAPREDARLTPWLGTGRERAKPLLTPPRHSRGMTVNGADGASFTWEIVSSAGRFDASFCVERTVGAEAGERHTRSRDSAVDWLRVERRCAGEIVRWGVIVGWQRFEPTASDDTVPGDWPRHPNRARGGPGDVEHSSDRPEPSVLSRMQASPRLE
jgi:hypothetical protein